MYRICSQPISSFGVICYRLAQTGSGGGDDRGGGGSVPRPEYLMVQRKDSLSYVEFIRGKYNVQNRGYIMRLLTNMTQAERAQLASSSFDSLWHGFWQSDHSYGFMKEYEQSRARFSMLRTGYYLRPADVHPPPPPPHPNPNPPQQQQQGQQQQQQHKGGPGPSDVVFFSLDTALSATAALATQTETEFGFPKGRRNINETDISCACREFSEETGLDVADIELVHPSGGRPHEEVFTGSNHTRYRHVYYLARLRADSGAWADAGNVARVVVDPVQSREVRAVAWFDADNVMSHLRPENSERRTLFMHVHRAISASAAASAAAESKGSATPTPARATLTPAPHAWMPVPASTPV